MKYKNKLKILIDGHCLGDKSGGNETYWRNIINGIEKSDNMDFTVILNKNTNLINDNVKHIKYSSDNTFYRNLISLPYNGFKGNYDVIHTQYYSPLFMDKRNVVTIHDISYEHFPECFSKKDLVINRNLIYKAAQNSKYIITVSEYSKKDIAERYNIDKNKIFVTYLGANDLYKPIKDIKLIEEICLKYGINNEYFLTVGNLQPRKNLKRLIVAFRQFKLNARNKNYKLVIVGKKGLNSDELFNNLNEDIIFTGYVPDQDLPYLYSGSSLFIYPSIFEGFGLPVLEAMKCGCVVLTSNTSSIPEVIGDSGMLFDPYNVDDITQKIIDMENNFILKEQLREKALNRSKLFSWDKTVKDTISVYNLFKKDCD